MAVPIVSSWMCISRTPTYPLGYLWRLFDCGISCHVLRVCTHAMEIPKWHSNKFLTQVRYAYIFVHSESNYKLTTINSNICYRSFTVKYHVNK